MRTGVRLALSNGDVLVGESVHTWTTEPWWHPRDQSYELLAVPALDGPFPRDASLRIIPADMVWSRESVPLAPEVPTYRDFMRGTGRFLHRSPLQVPAHVVMGNEGYHREEDGYGDFAWDLVVTDDAGVRFRGTGARNEDYLSWDLPVVAPAPGYVVEIVDDGPDQVPGSYPPGAVNNFVGIQLAGQVYVYLLHLRPGSIADAGIQVGDYVQPGRLLGRLGNAGVSLEPHLHVTLLYLDWTPLDGSPLRSWSVPGEWLGLHLSGAPVGSVFRAWSVPATGQWMSSEPF